MKCFFNIWIVCCLFFGVKLYGQEIELINNCEQKIYFSADQVAVCENALVAFLENVDGTFTKMLIPQINCDEEGLFVFASLIPMPYAIERCPKFHPSVCSKCGGCGASGCRYRCRCKK